MKKITEITYGNSLKINRGNYEQESPLYSAKTIIEPNGEVFSETEEYQRLRGIVDPLLNEHYLKAKADLSNLRIRVKDGKRYVSVTSILNPDPLPIDPEYSIRGTEVDRIVKNWIQTGVWEKPKEPLQKLKYEDIKYQEFCEKFKERIDFSKSELNIEVFHDKHLYSGEIDIICPVDGLPTIADFKTGSWDWKQLIAYYKARNNAKQLAIFDLKNGAIEILPLTDKKCVDNWETFLIKRGEIKSRFGI